MRVARRRMTDAEWTLQLLAAEEIEAFNRRAFDERGEFLWCEFPLSARCLEVLIAAARSSKCACDGGLVMSNGTPNRRLSFAADKLRAYGLLGKRESLNEFQPTPLGWEMLRAFAPDKVAFAPV
jgi:hypothetical protein